MSKEIFVFGSNLRGAHGKGSAKEALDKYGAIYGKGLGRQGNSYAIPTKDIAMQVLKLKEIKYFVDRFISYANEHPELRFNVCNITEEVNLDSAAVAPMFKHAPKNVKLSEEFNKVLNIVSPLRKYADIVVKEGLSTKKNADYCLLLIDDYAEPALEEFLNEVIRQAFAEGRQEGTDYSQHYGGTD